MAKRIYSIAIAISVVLGVYLYIAKETNSTSMALIVATLTFFLFSMGIHGVLAHTITRSDKGTFIDRLSYFYGRSVGDSVRYLSISYPASSLP